MGGAEEALEMESSALPLCFAKPEMSSQLKRVSRY
jgi:hypothetical protein